VLKATVFPELGDYREKTGFCQPTLCQLGSQHGTDLMEIVFGSRSTRKTAVGVLLELKHFGVRAEILPTM
jgi:hypothetical protein